MDCEDVIGGDLPTRFKYRQVPPNDYGLTVEEVSHILLHYNWGKYIWRHVRLYKTKTF
jgi:hypothetical protein